MLPKLWEKLGEGMAERWILTVFSPAFVFWAGGFVTYALYSNQTDLLQKLAKLSIVEQVAFVIAALILVSFSATVIERMQTSLLQFIEGYWPGWLSKVRFRLAKHWSDKIEMKYEELNTLAEAITPEGIARRSQLDNELAHLPINDPTHTMPTLLGNLLSAAEKYPQIRYGLDAIVCWPRLYPLLSDTLRQEIAAARGRLDAGTRLLVWSVLFSIWIVWQWWAVLGLVVAWLSYRGMVVTAGVYGDLIRTAYDLHRFDLYKSLNWPLPQKPEGEEKLGQELTAYLFRGDAPSGLDFNHNKEDNTPKK